MISTFCPGGAWARASPFARAVLWFVCVNRDWAGQAGRSRHVRNAPKATVAVKASPVAMGHKRSSHLPCSDLLSPPRQYCKNDRDEEERRHISYQMTAF